MRDKHDLSMNRDLGGKSSLAKPDPLPSFTHYAYGTVERAFVASSVRSNSKMPVLIIVYRVTHYTEHGLCVFMNASKILCHRAL